MDQDKSITKLAKYIGAEVIVTSNEPLLDKMSGGRPHNVFLLREPQLVFFLTGFRLQGYVLEASPLPKMPIIGLLPVKEGNQTFSVTMDYQSREDEAINGSDVNVNCTAAFSRYPFVIMLDGIVSLTLIQNMQNHIKSLLA
jgi:21S rRNA (GM2251-2'-O)-methyltransferase